MSHQTSRGPLDHPVIRLITGRRAWVVALLGLLLGGAIIGGIGQAERTPSALDSLPAGYDSTRGVELQQELPEDDNAAAIVVFSKDSADIAADLPALEELVSGLDAASGAPLIPAEDGTAAILPLVVPSATATQTADEVRTLRSQLGEGLPDGVTAQVTGPAAIEADLAAVFEGADITLLLSTAGVVALLLLITYRSPILWIIPLTVVGVADQVAAVAATHVLKAVGIPWDESTIGILSVLVFGAGTNYALLLISRYRDELRLTESRREAMAVALGRTSEAVFPAASTVFLGLVSLVLSVFPATRGLGLACAVGVVVAAVTVLVVLPATLVLFGRWVFWPKVPRAGQPLLADTRSLWRRVGDLVAKSPTTAILVTLAVLAGMAFGISRISLGLSTEDQFLDKPEAITAAERLAESFPAGSADPTIVVTRTDDPAALEALGAEIGAVDGVASVQPGEPEQGITQFSVVLEADSSSPEAAGAVDRLREAVADSPQTYVTGGEAQLLDATDGADRDRMLIIPIILGLVLLALMALLRSVVAPILLVASVLTTYAASLGLSWWLFTGVFGFSGLDAGAPLIAFLFLVALGVDYNIFLITRTLEEARGHGTRAGVLRALGATGGVITSAGILLAAVFAVLGVLPLVVLAQIGVIICLGVLLDTLVVRTVLVPALVLRLGDRFWWPRRVAASASPSGAQV